MTLEQAEQNWVAASGAAGGDHEVADRLRQAVRAAGGNRAVAARSGVPVGTVNRYVRAKGGRKVAALRAIAAACGVSLQSLLTGEQIPAGSDANAGETTPLGLGEPQAELTPPTADAPSGPPDDGVDVTALVKAIEIVAAIDAPGHWQNDPKAVAQRIARTYAVLTKPPACGD